MVYANTVQHTYRTEQSNFHSRHFSYRLILGEMPSKSEQNSQMVILAYHHQNWSVTLFKRYTYRFN